MNNARREQIGIVHNALEALKEDITSLQEEEQDAYDNTPDALQDSTQGESIQEAIDYFETAVNSLDEVLQALDDAKNCSKEA